MTRLPRARVVVVLAGLLAACRYQPTPVPLHGSVSDVAALAGAWEGDYSSADSRRGGSITFSIRPGVDTAFGDVAMVSTTGRPLIAADASTRSHAQHVRAVELLRVTFVEVSDGLVEGELEPYVAPDCSCVVTTVFRGAVTGDRIEGTYVTRGAQGLRQEGRWSMRRTPARPPG
jgi:hypothetical protein